MVVPFVGDSYDFVHYPTARDEKVKNVYSWLNGRRKDDNVNDPNLWRIHNKLYDLSDWIKLHPGGSEWISNTRGTDITEAFEVHHPNIASARNILKKYEVRETKEPRNSPFTFEENGFYCTLREKALPVIKSVGSGPTKQMNFIADGIFVTFILLSFLSAYTGSLLLAMLSGISVAMMAICAHNYFHQKDNWRMYYFDFAMVSSAEWRISHAMSHHLFANTIQDLEVSALEPFLVFLPLQSKTFAARYAVILYSNILYWILLPQQYIVKIISVLKGRVNFRIEFLIPIFELVIFLSLGLYWTSFWRGFLIWLVLHMTCSYWFVFVGLIAAHHHPDIWHYGDDLKYKSNDWGIRQIEAVRDRKDVTGNLFLVVTMFGDHTLHHLFPTVDHSKLKHLYPVFLETCKQFNIDFELYTIPSLALGKYQQLARNQPRFDSKE